MDNRTPTFQGHLQGSVDAKRTHRPLEERAPRAFETSGYDYPRTQPHIPEEWNPCVISGFRRCVNEIVCLLIRGLEL